MAVQNKAEVVWKGSLTQGSGEVEVGSGAFTQQPITWAARTEGARGGATSPEELIAAAHASCFAMALSSNLSKQGHAPDQLIVDATVTFDKTDGGWGIKTSQLDVRGHVTGISQAEFQQAAEGAKDNCPVSQALKGNVDIELNAELVE